jgi:hypothetical protein
MARADKGPIVRIPWKGSVSTRQRLPRGAVRALEAM